MAESDPAPFLHTSTLSGDCLLLKWAILFANSELQGIKM